MLKQKELTGVDKLKEVVSAIWSYVVQHDVGLSLSMNHDEFHLMVD